MRLVFYPGNDEIPPYMEVAGQDDLIPIDSSTLDPSSLAEAPLPDISEKLGVINPTLVVGPEGVDPFPGDITVLDYSVSVQSRPVVLPGFVYSEELQPLATTLGSVDEGAPDSSIHRVIFELDEDGSIQTGQIYTALRETEALENTITDNFVGYRYEFVANIKVEKILLEEGVGYGNLHSHQQLIMPGDIIVPYLSTTRTAPSSISPSLGTNADTAIVGLASEKFQLASDDTFVFLDNTASQLSVGQIINIYQSWDNFGGRIAAEYLSKDSRRIGQAYIIEASAPAAVGLLFNTLSPGSIGDTGDPAMLNQ
jgi:hypothetical protein